MRRTQAQRSAATRTRILEATCQSLVERGYAETTTAEVQARAGVPRGTLLHHFPTKVDLLVASVQHVARRRLDALTAELAEVTGDGLDAYIDAVWHSFSAPMFWAALELWAAARTDEELRAALLPVEKEIFGVLHERAVAVLGDDPRVPGVTQMTFEVMTGLLMTGIVSGDPVAGELPIRRWKRAAATLLGRASSTRGQ
ncbi:transcriptional regulator [Actinoplanes sp. SE50]|uniref:TetR/AcrR family transcriptional regulator n=1 Tax=unclassified Actinoplanes TaxID=2626549 RepID=UPI00023ECF28|nr:MULTISPECIES: TetR/AcrR family transcriptional regulator [unclassified Actinoplanes]AEV86626.1 TetR family transcriptional regulator [Actinoplanes sp. SE50/110]ATO85024.1 transcriptional regulator [Actinoplanes sp. SE50]SLM02434.1 transcriptional regulator [Actinoplanes sp. SE50/110]